MWHGFRALILPVDAPILAVGLLVLGLGRAAIDVREQVWRRLEPVAACTNTAECGVQTLLLGLAPGHGCEHPNLVRAVGLNLGKPGIGVDGPADLDQPVGAGLKEHHEP